MFTTGRLAVVVVALFCGACALWWWGLSEYRETAATVGRLRGDMAKMSKDMVKMQEHVQETERVLAAVESLRHEVQNHRSRTNEEFEGIMCYDGSERLDRLERLLKEDLARRGGGGDNASGRVAR